MWMSTMIGLPRRIQHQRLIPKAYVANSQTQDRTVVRQIFSKRGTSLVEMDPLKWQSRPELDRPVLIAAFAGWNDAGDSATTAVQFLSSTWNATQFAEIDPEEFFDFTSTRPVLRLEEGVIRHIQWPSNRLSRAAIPERGQDIVFLDGMEPQLRWRTFSNAVIECAKAIDVSMVVTLGALLADVPHTRPAPVNGTTSSTTLTDGLGLQMSRYEGPTGITGVLHETCRQAGIESASLWAAVPHYVSQTPSPKAALALVQRTASLIDTPVDTAALETASIEYEQQVSSIVNEDEDMVSYVAQLEENNDAERLQNDNIVAEAERFLRDQES